MSYFENLPIIQHKDSESGTINIVTNILKRAGIKKTLHDSIIRYYTENIHTKDRPEVFSASIYDDPNKHWISMMLNSVTDPYYDWVLSDENFSSMVNEKYPNKYVIIDTPDDNVFVGDEYGNVVVIDYMPLPRKEIKIYDENNPNAWVATSGDIIQSQIIYSIDENFTGVLPDDSSWTESNTGLELNAIHHLEYVSTPVFSGDKITSYTNSYDVVTNLDYEISVNVENGSINTIHENFIDEVQSQLEVLFK